MDIAISERTKALSRPSSAGNREEIAASLQELNALVQQCLRCEALCQERNQTVFGVGNPEARLVFVGEAPGAEEDRLGEPFVGAAGKLLTKIIEACGMRRDDVYICNILKCRPPQNRRPLPAEVAHCRGYLDMQLALIKPQFICALGSTAATTLLETAESMARLRGKFHDYRGIPVLCTYHPAYLLRNPPAKVDVWNDMKLLLEEMRLSVPAGTRL